MGTCHHCLMNRELCNSHAIPKAIFRDIQKQQAEADLIKLGYDGKRLRLDGHTGDYPLLCSACENFFNFTYDAKLVEFLRLWDHTIVLNGFRTRMDNDPNWLAEALISVLWRASISQSQQYDNFDLGSYFNSYLHDIITSKDALVRCSVKIESMFDPTDQMQKHLFSRCVVNPAVHQGRPSNHSESKFLKCVMAFSGFFFSIFLPRLSPSKRNRAGFLKHANRRLHAPAKNMFKEDWFVELGAISRLKSEIRHITKGMKRRERGRMSSP